MSTSGAGSGTGSALAGLLPILFLGAASTDLLFPFQIFYFGAMAAGLGALLVIEREGKRGDALACALLVLSFTFSELALPFVLGVGVAIAQARGPLRRAYVVVVPLVLYAVWYAGWGHTGTSYLSFHNVANSPVYVLDGLASGLVSLLGLTPSGPATGNGLGWGRPLLLAVLVLAVLRLRSGRPVPRSFWVTLTILLSFWFVTAANANFARAPFASRYQYAAAVLLLPVAADLASGLVRPRAPAVVLALGIAVAAVLGNFEALHNTYREFRYPTPTVRGGLAGLEVEADTVDPALTLDQQNSGFDYIGSIRAGPYLSAVRAFGSPAYSPSELPRAPERARVAADLVMGTALRLAVRPTTNSRAGGEPLPRVIGPPGSLVSTKGGCARVRPVAGGFPVLAPPPGGVVLRAPPGATTRLALRRFATESFPISAGELTGSGILAIPPDRSSQPWQLQLAVTRAISVCGLRT